MNMKQLPLFNLHEKHGARFKEIDGMLLPGLYTSTSEEYGLVESGTGILDLSHRGKLRLSGKEHLRFLQGMLSNDVMKLETGRGLHATLLNVKGKMLADLYLYKEDDYVLVDLEHQIHINIHELLLKYRLSYKAQIENITDQFVLLSLIGNGVKQFMNEFLDIQSLNMDGMSISTFRHKESDIIIVTPKRAKFDSVDIYIPVNNIDFVYEIIGYKVNGIKTGLIGYDTYEIMRVEAGIPRYGIDMDENTIPIEAGLWDALNFEKGCYIGQEVIARIKWRGHVNRHLSLIEIQGSDIPSFRDKIYIKDKEIGYVTSSVFSYERNNVIALCYLRRGFNDTGSDLKVISRGSEIEGKVVDVTL